MLRFTSTTQGVIALSSGESEFYALAKETSAGLGAVSMLKDFGVDINKNTKSDKAVLEVRVDASAGRGTAVRRGAGRIRHIATPTLWVQKKSSRKMASSKSQRFLEPRAWPILEPNIRDASAGIALRAEVQEIMCEVGTQSEMEVELEQH